MHMHEHEHVSVTQNPCQLTTPFTVFLQQSWSKYSLSCTKEAKVSRKRLTQMPLVSSPSAAEEEPRLLGTVENKLGIADWLKEQGHE